MPEDVEIIQMFLVDNSPSVVFIEQEQSFGFEVDTTVVTEVVEIETQQDSIEVSGEAPVRVELKVLGEPDEIEIFQEDVAADLIEIGNIINYVTNTTNVSDDGFVENLSSAISTNITFEQDTETGKLRISVPAFGTGNMNKETYDPNNDGKIAYEELEGVQDAFDNRLLDAISVNISVSKDVETGKLRLTVPAFGTGNMSKETYDPNNDGKINYEQLEGVQDAFDDRLLEAIAVNLSVSKDAETGKLRLVVPAFGTGNMSKETYDPDNNGKINYNELEGVQDAFDTRLLEAITTNFSVSKDVATGKIKFTVPSFGTGNMSKETYDYNNNGIVDDSERLGGVLSQYYAEKTYVQTASLNGGYF